MNKGVSAGTAINFVLCLFLMGFGVYCGPALMRFPKAQELLVEEAKQEIRSVKEFTTLFPEARPHVYTRRFERGTTVIQMRAIVYDRYDLMLTARFEVDRRLRISSVGTNSIHFNEMTLIEGKPSGQLHTRYDGDHFKLSDEQWRKVVEAGGDFAAAGIPVKTNQPTPGVEDYKRYWARQF
jgi:hypothetical protein